MVKRAVEHREVLPEFVNANTLPVLQNDMPLLQKINF